MKKLSGGRKFNIIYSLVAVAIIFAVWLIAYCVVRNDYILPSVGDSFAELFVCFGRAYFWKSFLATFLRTLIAFAVSFIAAAVCAAAGSVCRTFGEALSTLISFVRTLPTMAITLMLLIWTTPKVAPVLVAILVLFPMIYSQFTAAIGGIDGGLKEMAAVYRLSNRQKLFKIYLPQVAPNVLSQVGSDISLGIKLMVSAEVLSYTYQSLGGMMQQAKLYAEMPQFAALTITCIIIGFAVEAAGGCLNRITCKWNRRDGADED